MSYISNILNKDPTDPKVTDVYDLGEVLGKGAFGVVRRAVHKQTGQAVACKSISKSRLVCKEDVEDVKKEVAILSHLAGHPNVVSMKSTHEDKNAVHICMTLCSGGELFDSIVQAGNFSEKKAAHIFRVMVETVRHCHEFGVMHRDLKPENFLLTSKDAANQKLKLVDFGLGVFFTHGERFKDLVGSPYYVAPEVLKRNYSHEADLWSLGVILYIMLSGLPPFWGDTEDQIFKMVLAGKLDFNTAPWPSLSEECKDCIKRLCVMDPSKRMSAADVLKHPWLQKTEEIPDQPIDHVVVERIRNFAAMNRMKKAAMLVVGQSLEPAEIVGIHRLFQSIDADGSGFITVNELRTSLSEWGRSINDDELNTIMEIADVDGNGSIDYNEFVAATMHISKLQREALLKKAFEAFDLDGNGRISEDEIKQVLNKFHMTDDASALLNSADIDKDGTIDYEEFRQMMRSHDKGNGDDDDGECTENPLVTALRGMRL